MDFSQAFLFPAKDPDWLKKIILVALLSLIPLFGQIVVLGWTMETIRRAIGQDSTLLPDLEIGKQFSEGLRAFAVGLVYSIPIFIMIIPFLAVSTITLQSDSQSNSSIMMIAILCFEGFVFLYSLVLAVIYPVAIAHVVAQNRIGAAFEFRALFRLVRAAPLSYLMAIVGAFAASSLAGFGVIACAIGVLFTYAYAAAVTGNLYGQAYREASQKAIARF